MLSKLVVTGFQKHDKKITIEFNQVTTIVGPTDTGKSALLRALRWICQNVPSGNSFISHSKDVVTVRLLVDDHLVVHKRTKNLNIYKLDEKVYKAFGGKVPDTIVALLNVSDLNFQAQLDSPFWFCETPGKVSQELNQIVNLSEIDNTLTNIASELRKARSTIDVCETRLADAIEQKKSLSWVVEFNRRLSSLEQQRETLDLTCQKRLALADLIFSIQSLITECKRVEQLIVAGNSVLKLVEKAEATHQELLRVREQRKKLQRSIEEIHQTWQNLKEAKEEVIRLTDTMTKEMGTRCPLCSAPLKKSLP